MNYRIGSAMILAGALCCLVSCAQVSKRMPSKLSQMHEFLTQDSPGECRKYHYNFERQAPRLYGNDQPDSILDVIDYIKTECGPATNLEVPRMLLLAERGQFGDSLIGSATISQMLWYRSAQENLLDWRSWDYLYGRSEPTDNTHDNFTQFIVDLGHQVSSNPEATQMGRTVGLFYSGAFDSAFSSIQSDDLHGTKLQRSYDDFISRTKGMFPTRGNIAILVGSWRPQGNNDLLGNHPDIGVQLGGEGKWWRADGILSIRFSPTKSRYQVDSLGHLVSTNEFNSLFLAVEGGFKLLDYSRFSTDLFAGFGYDVIYSISTAGDPEEEVTHGSAAASIGLRQRIFLNERTGWYIGGIVRYNVVDYNNPGGTDLSGNTLTISMVCGWSYHETLKQFLEKLNYKGNWRQ